MKLKPGKPYYNVDPVTKQIVSDALYDGYRDETESLVGRWGLTEFCNLGTGAPGDGGYWWDKAGIPVVVSAGRAFTFSRQGIVTELTGGDFATGTPVVFAAGQKVDNSGILMACNGNRLNYSVGGAFTPVDSPAPQEATHVVYNGLRFLANEKDTARFVFSDIDPDTGEFDPLYWDAIENPLTSDTRGDNILGLYQAWDDIAVWGGEGREIWQVTGGAPPLETRLGAFCEAGLIAPYSVQKADNTFFALCNVDGKPAVIRLQGNDPLIISTDIERVLDGLSTLNDAIGDIVSVGGQSFYLLTFPTEDQTWAYNIKLKEWYRWSWWNQDFATREAFIGRHFFYARQWGMHFCVSRTTGKVYRVDVDATTDDGNTIRTEWQSGRADGGTSKNKRVSLARFLFKRGVGDGAGSEPVAVIRWRDNGNMEWKNERQISLGKQGHYEVYKELYGLGMFRNRQFSIIFTDPAERVFVEMDVDVQAMGV